LLANVADLFRKFFRPVSVERLNIVLPAQLRNPQLGRKKRAIVRQRAGARRAGC
jgi:hypothetical protein